MFREKENEAWLDRWRRTARQLIDRRAADAQLREAQQDFAADGTEENLQDLEAALAASQGRGGLGNRIAGLRIFMRQTLSQLELMPHIVEG